MTDWLFEPAQEGLFRKPVPSAASASQQLQIRSRNRWIDETMKSNPVAIWEIIFKQNYQGIIQDFFTMGYCREEDFMYLEFNIAQPNEARGIIREAKSKKSSQYFLTDNYKEITIEGHPVMISADKKTILVPITPPVYFDPEENLWYDMEQKKREDATGAKEGFHVAWKATTLLPVELSSVLSMSDNSDCKLTFPTDFTLSYESWLFAQEANLADVTAMFDRSMEELKKCDEKVTVVLKKDTPTMDDVAICREAAQVAEGLMRDASKLFSNLDRLADVAGIAATIASLVGTAVAGRWIFKVSPDHPILNATGVAFGLMASANMKYIIGGDTFNASSCPTNAQQYMYRKPDPTSYKPKEVRELLRALIRDLEIAASNYGTLANAIERHLNEKSTAVALMESFTFT